VVGTPTVAGVPTSILDAEPLSRVWVTTDDNDGCALRHLQGSQIQRVADGAYVTRIRVEEVHRPVLRLLVIVAEGPRDFDLDRPVPRDQKIGRALGPDRSGVAPVLI
jgi:hypothetical protein